MFQDHVIGLKYAILGVVTIPIALTNGVVVAVIVRYRELWDDRITVEPLLYDHHQNHIGVVV